MEKSIDFSRCHHHAIMSIPDDHVLFRVSLEQFKSFYLACLVNKDKSSSFEKFIKEFRMFFDNLPKEPKEKNIFDIIGFKGYEVIRNGNIFVAGFDNIKMAKRKMESLSKRGIYVELWACYEDGSRHLVDYMN